LRRRSGSRHAGSLQSPPRAAVVAKVQPPLREPRVRRRRAWPQPRHHVEVRHRRTPVTDEAVADGALRTCPRLVVAVGGGGGGGRGDSRGVVRERSLQVQPCECLVTAAPCRLRGAWRREWRPRRHVYVHPQPTPPSKRPPAVAGCGRTRPAAASRKTTQDTGRKETGSEIDYYSCSYYITKRYSKLGN
jgi:hypothetical protein